MNLTITRRNGDQHVVLYDEQDHDLIASHTWCVYKSGASRTLYCATSERVRSGAGGTRLVLMHRLILPGVESVDHANGDGLDNRRSNLRAATQSQQNANRAPSPHTSRFKGVCWDKSRGLWRATIKDGGYIGRFKTEEEAARAYDARAIEMHGEFAYLNFPVVQTLNGASK